MKKFSKKNLLKFFYIFDLFLILAIVLTAVFSGGRSSKKTVQMRLITEKEIPRVYEIVLSENSRQTVLLNNGSFWMGTDGSIDVGNADYWPCDEERVQNLLQKASNIIKLYKISDSYTVSDSFMLSEKDGFSITFYDGSGKIISSVVFGSVDSISGRVHFRFWNEKTVYQISDDWEPFLSVSENSWCDPWIFPQAVTGFSRSRSQSLLRRGGLYRNFSSDTNLSENVKNYTVLGAGSDSALKKENLAFNFGNGRKIVYSVYEAGDDGTYILTGKIYPGPADSDLYKKSVLALNYAFSVSEWTYKKLCELDSYYE